MLLARLYLAQSYPTISDLAPIYVPMIHLLLACDVLGLSICVSCQNRNQLIRLNSMLLLQSPDLCAYLANLSDRPFA